MGHSRRRIALPSIAVDALRRHRVRQAEERLRVGNVWQEKNLVFPNTRLAGSTTQTIGDRAGSIR